MIQALKPNVVKNVPETIKKNRETAKVQYDKTTRERREINKLYRGQVHFESTGKHVMSIGIDRQEDQ